MADATLFSTTPRAGAGVAPVQGADGAPAGRYTNMRESGVPWLGRVPTHWTMRRLKTNLSRNDGGVWGEDFDPDGTIVLRSTEQTVGGDWKIDDPARRALSASERAGALLAEGDLVITKSSGSEFHIGKTSIVTAEVAALGCCFSNFMQRLRCDRRTAPRFAYYILNSPIGREQMVYGSNTSTGLANLNGGVMGNIVAAWPPLPEQEAIAAWLDERTRRIDELVAAKRRLIDLLAEQRTALITHAVTKGLNPAAPVKRSGIEWLGDMPRHWEVKRIKFIARVGNGSTPSRENPEYWSGDYPWLNSGVVNLREVTEASDFVTELALAECHLPIVSPPAVLVGITGEGKTRGMATVLRIEATINQHLAFVKPSRSTCNAEFLRYALHAAYQFLRDESGGGGSTKGALTCSQLANVSVPFPSPDEQRDIVTHLDAACTRFDALTGAAEDAITRLTEYRQAIISAAVTGKIRVCEAVHAADCGAQASQSTGAVTHAAGQRRGANKHFQRTVLAAQIIATIGSKPTFGRIKLQKAMVLAEYHLRLDEIQSEPVRAAAGPFDNPMMRSVDSQLKRSQWYDYNQSQRGGKYVALAKAGGHAQYFDRYWSDRRSGFDALMKTLDPMTTEQAEIVATLYAAWNDFLIDGTAVTDDALVAEVMNNWHPDKDKITEQQWRAAIPWMRQHGLVPTGYGAHTRVASHDGSKE